MQGETKRLLASNDIVNIVRTHLWKKIFFLVQIKRKPRHSTMLLLFWLAIVDFMWPNTVSYNSCDVAIVLASRVTSFPISVTVRTLLYCTLTNRIEWIESNQRSGCRNKSMERFFYHAEGCFTRHLSIVPYCPVVDSCLTIIQLSSYLPR